MNHPDDTEGLIEAAVATVANDRNTADQQHHADNLTSLVSAMMAHGRLRQDPVRTLTACLGDRWTPLIMNLLIGGMLRFGELRRLICLVSVEGDISQRMLTLKLRLLERDGLVQRTVTKEATPRVEYRLTPLGLGAYRQYEAVMHWAEQATPAIRCARLAYDAQHVDGPKLAQAPRDGNE